MRQFRTPALRWFFTLILWLPALAVHAQSSTFTYQGRLTDNGTPANGIYDLQFSLFNLDSGGAPLAGPLTRAPLAVSNGIFVVTLDFGAANFDGGNRWLQIAVRPNGSPSPHTVLVPRQPITSAPYAITAASLSGGVLTGSLTNNSGANADAIFSEGGIDRSATNSQTFAFTNSGGGGLTLQVRNEVRTGAGTAAAPAFSFIANTNTGAFNPGSNVLAFATAGNERMRIYTNGTVGIGTTTPSTSTKLDVAGNVSVGGLLALASASAPVSVGSTISPSASYLVVSAGSVVTLNATTAIADPAVAGAVLILQGTSDVNTVTVPDNANTRLAGNRILGDGDTLTLIFNGTVWVEIAYANN